VLAGQPCAGLTHSVGQAGRSVDCSCEDSHINNAVCKHIRALQALGLISRHAEASIVKAYQLSLTDELNPPPNKPRNITRARRLHKAPLPGPEEPRIIDHATIVPAPPKALAPAAPGSFTAGFRAAIADHISSQNGSHN
jgi:hypothetical protein